MGDKLYIKYYQNFEPPLKTTTQDKEIIPAKAGILNLISKQETLVSAKTLS